MHPSPVLRNAARDQQCAKRTFDGLTQPVDHLRGVGGADSEGIGEVGAVQAVAVGQLENRAVAVGQPAGGFGNQIGEFGAGGQGFRARLMRHGVRQFVRKYFAATFPDAAQRFIAGDRIQPRAQFVRLLAAASAASPRCRTCPGRNRRRRRGRAAFPRRSRGAGRRSGHIYLRTPHGHRQRRRGRAPRRCSAGPRMSQWGAAVMTVLPIDKVLLLIFDQVCWG